MTALLRIDQDGLPEGEAGKSRTDGKADGSLVTLTDTSPSGTTAFKILWTPPGDSTAVATLAASPDPRVWTFAPTPNKYGSYVVELLRNAGLVSEVSERRVLVVRTPSLGLVIPGLNERGYSKASLDNPTGAETADNNATDFADPDLNALPYAAWWRAMHELITAVDASSGDGAEVKVTIYSSGELERHAYDSLDAAFAGTFTGGSTASTATIDVGPNLHAPPVDTATLAAGATYLLRAAAGPGSVELPELVASSATVQVESCTVGAPVTGPGGRLIARDARVTAGVDVAAVDARDTTFAAGATVTVDDDSTFDRCTFGNAVPIVCTGMGSRITFTNCVFGASPSLVFTTGESVGVVRMDSRSKFMWDNSFGNVTNGAPIVVEGS
jgi:hypothetical protein